MAEKIIAVNKCDQIRGGVDRYVAHSDAGILHRGFLITVKNYKNEIYIAQRAAERPDLKNFPPPFSLQWDGSIAGHPRVGNEQGYLDRAVAELKEELDLTVKKTDLRWLGRFYYNTRDPLHPKVIEKEVCGVLLMCTHQEPKPDKTELAQGKWVPAKDLQKIVGEFAKNNIVEHADGTLEIINFDAKKMMFVPWFVKAQQLWPEIYRRTF